MPQKNKKIDGAERRRARRTMVQESFNLFLVIPEVHGLVRIYMRDISKLGLCFRSEMESSFEKDQCFQARLYLNPAFYLPLACRVVRVGQGEVALEFTDQKNASIEAVAKLLDFFELAEKAGVLVE